MGKITIEKVKGKQNPADVLTKYIIDHDMEKDQVEEGGHREEETLGGHDGGRGGAAGEPLIDRWRRPRSRGV